MNCFFNSISITIVHSSLLTVLNAFVTVRLLCKTFSVLLDYKIYLQYPIEYLPICAQHWARTQRGEVYVAPIFRQLPT